MWKCSKCGAENWDDSKICHRCNPSEYKEESKVRDKRHEENRKRSEYSILYNPEWDRQHRKRMDELAKQRRESKRHHEQQRREIEQHGEMMRWMGLIAFILLVGFGLIECS